MKYKIKIAVLSMTLVIASTSMAMADTFSPQNDPPTIAGLIVPNALEPSHPRSVSTYTVSAIVGSQAGVANIKSVDICWYNKDQPSVSSNCANAATDPINEFRMQWLENGELQTGGPFSVIGTNNYADSGSVADYGAGTSLTMNIDFKFRISEAMHFGNNWSLHVWVTDDQNQISEETNAFNEWFVDGLSVSYFGQVATSRTSQSFGDLKTGQSSLIENISTGTYLANGNSDITMEATSFSYLNETIDLGSYPPASKFASMLCNSGQTFDQGSAVLIGTLPNTLVYDNFDLGTGEGTGTLVEHSCRLDFAGGATVANVPYTNTVTLAIINGM